MSGARAQLAHWASTVAYVILALFVAVAIHLALDAVVGADQGSKDRARDNTLTLRKSCEDRNQRDRQIAFGLARVAATLDAEPTDMAPLLTALEPRDCENLYPLPD